MAKKPKRIPDQTYLQLIIDAQRVLALNIQAAKNAGLEVQCEGFNGVVKVSRPVKLDRIKDGNS